MTARTYFKICLNDVSDRPLSLYPEIIAQQHEHIVRSRQERYRRSVALLPKKLEQALAADDAAVSQNNLVSAAAIITRRNAYDYLHKYRAGTLETYKAWRQLPRWQRIGILSLSTATILPLPFVIIIGQHWKQQQRKAVKARNAIRTPIPPRRHYQQARNFNPAAAYR